MNLLLHTPFFHPMVGGVETFTAGLAGELAARGHRVTVLAENPAGAAGDGGFPFRVVRGDSADRSGLVRGADALLAVGPPVRMVPAAWRAGVPVVLIHQGPAGDCPIGIGWRDGRRCRYSLAKCLGCRVSNQSVAANVRRVAAFQVLRSAVRRAAANVFVSQAVADRVPAPRSRVVGNFFDPAVFRPDAAVAVEPVFLFVGRLVPIKGVDVAVRAFATARRNGLGHRLRIVGDGPERASLERLAAAEGVGEVVEFAGGKRGTDLADEYRRATAVLFASQWEEPFGIVMVEAMGCGTPVIASAHGACPEVVGDAGVLVPGADVGAWARAMTELAADPQRRAVLAERALAQAHSTFTLAAIADRYEAVLRAVAPEAR
jgi:glycosyltransferase involved in cell wall biosynthesis